MSTRHLLFPPLARSCPRRARQYLMQSFRFAPITPGAGERRMLLRQATVELRWGGGFQGLFMHYFSPPLPSASLSRRYRRASGPRRRWNEGKKEGGARHLGGQGRAGRSNLLQPFDLLRWHQVDRAIVIRHDSSGAAAVEATIFAPLRCGER